jgi:3-phosphoshikimate 1-carboxyvinyltransferase
MTEARLVEPLARPPDTTVVVPGSKSITNRALVTAALASGESELTGALFADDTAAMLDCLTRLRAEVVADEIEATVRVAGMGGRLPDGPLELDARLSGTTARFVLPVLALGPGPYRLDGGEPLRRRPMADGIEAVRALGAHVADEGERGHLPLTVRGGASAPAEVRVPGSVSSQFLSGLLLAGPCFAEPVTIDVTDELVSLPYVEMTLAVMASFGAGVERNDARSWTVAPGGYRGTRHAIEPDASAASYFFAAAAITGGRVTVSGLGPSSVQGDLRFVDVLEEMGAEVRRDRSGITVESSGTLRGVDVDLRDFSDTSQTLAVTAVFADSPTTIRGIGFIRGKETDRIAAMVTELRRCGVRAEELDDGIRVHPAEPGPARIETYADHRMAMSFALLGLRVRGIEIADPGCVAKTFPEYFEVLETLRRQ